jgi:hypothetical protein
MACIRGMPFVGAGGLKTEFDFNGRLASCKGGVSWTAE